MRGGRKKEEKKSGGRPRDKDVLLPYVADWAVQNVLKKVVHGVQKYRRRLRLAREYAAERPRAVEACHAKLRPNVLDAQAAKEGHPLCVSFRANNRELKQRVETEKS